MARKHGGLGRGLDALIPMRQEVEKAMQSADSEGVEILFADEDEADEPDIPQLQTRSQNRFRRESDQQPVRSDQEKKDVSRETQLKNSSEIQNETTRDIQKEPASIITNKEKAEKTNKEKSDAIIVRISEVEPNREQPRKKFDEEKLQELSELNRDCNLVLQLQELSESIKTYGLLQPILVQKRDEYYEIIAGERRWRAALKAGLKEIPVIVGDYSEKEILELSLIENIQREDLNPIEEAEAYKRLMDEFRLGQAEVAARVSKSRSAVANSLRLLKLEERVRKMVVDGQLSMGHARAILPVEDADQQYELAQKITEKQLSVRETEKIVKEMLKSGAEQDKSIVKIEKQEEDPSIAIIYKQIEERLQQSLHTKVSIQRKRNGHGKLQIDFYNSDDLEKIIDRLTDR